MKTPIYDFVKQYSQSGIARLHMPGHKGVSFLGCENADITEVNGADALYHSSGIISESEKNATSLFGSFATFYSAEGSSQCIKAMLFLAKTKSNSTDFTVLAARNVHKSFVYACALLGIKVRWLFDDSDDYTLCRCRITAVQLEAELKKRNADAVYITSPDYLGTMSGISSLAEVTHRYGAFMLVDNAHGAYLRFLDKSLHPMDKGADMCCDSAHKTLPVLTGGAYLHIKNDIFADNAKRALEMFGSTSPSYLILQSLDLCNVYLADDYGSKLASCVEKVNDLKQRLSDNGWKIYDSDPLKLTVYTGNTDFCDRLRKNGIECEYEDPDYTVMMFTPETDSDVYDNLLSAAGVNDVSVTQSVLSFSEPKKMSEIRDAIFAECEEISIENAAGRVVADTCVGCPPAVPVLVSGEEVTAEAVEVMRYYGINTIKVIKKQ